MDVNAAHKWTRKLCEALEIVDSASTFFLEDPTQLPRAANLAQEGRELVEHLAHAPPELREVRVTIEEEREPLRFGRSLFPSALDFVLRSAALLSDQVQRSDLWRLRRRESEESGPTDPSGEFTGNTPIGDASDDVTRPLPGVDVASALRHAGSLARVCTGTWKFPGDDLYAAIDREFALARKRWKAEGKAREPGGKDQKKDAKSPGRRRRINEYPAPKKYFSLHRVAEESNRTIEWVRKKRLAFAEREKRQPEKPELLAELRASAAAVSAPKSSERKRNSIPD